MTEVAATCAFTCTGSGDDDMASLAQKIAIRKYKAEVIDGGASDTSTSFCGRVGKTYNWPCLGALPRELGGAPDERRELFEKKADCEDSADEVVQQLSQEALGRALSCAGLKDIVGACNRAIVMKHCPASCGLCEDREYLERHMELANMYGEMNHRQLKKIC